jgi:predicted DCC family thiol-disulfide oxidoreductase YuxK
VNTEITVNKARRGWVFYDADCSLCARAAARLSRLLERLGFQLVPLQTPGTAERLGVTFETLLARMHLLTADGRCHAGADAFVEIARHARWARPLVAATRLPAVLPLLRRGYDWIAARRYCFGGACRVPRRPGIVEWLALLPLPFLALAVRPHLADWVFMWAMACALFAGCKWLTYRKAVAEGAKFSIRRAAGYLLGWVGMEPSVFAKTGVAAQRPRAAEWIAAIGRVVLGAAVVWVAVRLLHPTNTLAAGWLGMVGIILILHFGLFHLLALVWQRAGVAVKPLMRAPSLATSLGDFWGARWNTGFHTLAHELVFRPLRRRTTKTFAVLVVFLVSGLIHELVITLPARGGYGLPTVYFLLQGLGLVIERGSLGRTLGFSEGIRGRTFALLCAAAPAFWLFPPVFVHNVILPMLHALGAV